MPPRSAIVRRIASITRESSPPDAIFATNFTAAMLTYGTKKMNRIELATEIEGMAGGINGFSGRNSSGVQANFLSKFFDKGLTLFADVVQNPSFPEDEMEKLRKDILAAIKKEEDYLPGYTFKLLYRELYKKHPYGMTVSGAPEVVSALKKEDLARHYDAIFVPSRMILTIVGDVYADYAVEKIKDAFKGFDRKAGPMPALAIDALPQGILSTGEYKDKAQTNIGMGFIGPTALSKDIYATEVLTDYYLAFQDESHTFEPSNFHHEPQQFLTWSRLDDYATQHAAWVQTEHDVMLKRPGHGV